MTISDIISTARKEVPDAFLAETPDVFEQLGRIISPDTYLLLPNEPMIDVRELPKSLDDLSDRDREDIIEAESMHHEFGLDIFAFYVSFHFVPEGAKWGIFYYRRGLRRLALLLTRDLSIPGALAYDAVLNLLRQHEKFHFWFDIGALHHELVVGRGLYTCYSRDVYERVILTDSCYEESLANRLSIDRCSHKISDRVKKKSGKSFRRFVKEFYLQGPPGYRDFQRNPGKMRMHLGGQLHEANPAAQIAEPLSEWIGIHSSVTQKCPEYVLNDWPISLGRGRFFRIKMGGYIWTVHKTDPDFFPSKPHAKDYERRVKLHLGTGEIFAGRKRRVGKLKYLTLMDIRDKITQRMPDLPLPKLV